MTVNRDFILKHFESEDLLDIKVTGQSMRPLLIHGDTKVRIVKTQHVNESDIILFNYNQKIVLHRIIKKKGDTYFCRGDALTHIESINIKDVIGKVSHINGIETKKYEKDHLNSCFIQTIKHPIFKVKQYVKKVQYKFTGKFK
jgi:signal peptidase I